MGGVLATLLSILVDVAGVANSASTVAKIIAALVELLPLLGKEIMDLKPMVSNIINALSSNPSTTPEQLVQLEAVNAKADAAFEAAARAALAEDAAADVAGAQPAPNT